MLRQIEARIADRRDDARRARLDTHLTADAGGSTARFVWLRQFEVGRNPADMNRLLDRLESLRDIALNEAALAGVPFHRIARLRRPGERYFAGDLRDISGDRRLAILAVGILKCRSAVADAVVATHDRIVCKTSCEAKSRCYARADGAKAALNDTLQAFSTLEAAREDWTVGIAGFSVQQQQDAASGGMTMTRRPRRNLSPAYNRLLK